MKLNKKISKFLVLGILTNNLYFNSSANTDIPNRYETLEGEYITIDDSTEGNLEEIEIFGNTVQNENNLEDIQSVGDLYVDEDGNPILDKQGREQYAIEIISKENSTIRNNEMFINTEAHFLQPSKSGGCTSFYIENIKSNVEYNFTVKSGIGNRFVIATFDSLSSGAQPVEVLSRSVSFNPISSVTPTKSAKYMYVYTCNTVNPDIDIEITSEYTKVKKDKILIPTQLQKVGNIADRLYWDTVKGKYIVEKNIEKINLKDYEYTYNRSATDWISPDGINYGGPSRVYTFNLDVDSYLLNLKYNGFYSTNILRPTNASMLYNGFHNDDGRAVNRLGLYGGGCYVRVEDSIAGNTTEDFLNWIKNANISFYSTRTSPLLIETNITSKLKIPIYNNKTYIYIESNSVANPILKVVVDRLPQIARDAVLEAENNFTSYNISLARMYVNMLPESLYKDQLQERLSQVFSSDITLDRESASSNLDVYVKSQNMLSMSLDTNSITFEDYSGVDAMEMLSAVNISINSSLPYDLNAYIPVEISNADGINIMDLDILNIRESSEAAYQTFKNTTDKIVLKSDCVKGNDINHSIDLKLDSNAAHKADVYKTVIKFEAEQK